MPRTDVGAGCAVAVFDRNRRFIMMHRTGKHAGGTYCLPGGWIEMFEDILEAGRREVMEELGARVRGIEIVGVANNIRKDENHHSISVILAAVLEDGESPKNNEPEKCDGIFWVDDWDSMPQPTMVAYNECVGKDVIEKYLAENL